MAERLQKLLARAGYGSRRDIERAIAAGRVRVNERTAALGDRAGARDRIRLDGRLLNLEKRHAVKPRVLAYKKHVDQVVTRRDPQGRPTVFKNLPKLAAGRWLAVGRLDINTSGLLLLTTDGELKRRLEHPSYALVRRYAVRVRGAVDAAMLERLQAGVMLDDGRAWFETIYGGGDANRANQWFTVAVRAGRNRIVRRLWASQGVTVSRLIRVGFGPVDLPGGVKAGRWRELTRAEVRALAAGVGFRR
jgi:23S rRNA pseudouridine2605 synthase